MTDATFIQAAAPVRPRSSAPRRHTRIWPTIAVAVASFAVLFEFLAFQLTAGNDPAIGTPEASAPRSQPQPVLNRRIVKTKVVHLPPETTTTASASSAVSPATASVPAPAPVTSSAPAPVAPAPAAPVTSSS